jgi:predicted AAA+ superfamily ATPase
MPTVRNYLEILETIFVVRRVPAWSAGATRRAVATPKLIFVDSGLASSLTAGVRADASVGGMVESFVLAELARQLSTRWTRCWRTTPARSSGSR